MTDRVCPGLPADWLNGWLAAIGALVLCPDLRLSWTKELVPAAVLSSARDDPLDLLIEAWPSSEALSDMPGARRLDEHLELPPNPTVEAWTDRARRARADARSWTLSSFYTDLVWDRRTAAHVVKGGLFNAPGTGPAGTLHERVTRMASAADAAHLDAVLAGVAPRVGGFGLGFDVTRVTGKADKAGDLVVPHIEVLTYFGLSAFPVRGNGLRRRHRSWLEGPERFWWCTWSPPLTLAGVDALLDAASSDRARQLLGITESFESVRYDAPGGEYAIGLGTRRVSGE